MSHLYSPASATARQTVTEQHSQIQHNGDSGLAAPNRRSRMNLNIGRIKRALVASTTVAAATAALALSPALTASASAEVVSWPDASSVCVGSGAQTGFAMTIGVTEHSWLNASQLGEEVYWRAWLHIYDSRSGAMYWRQASQWSHYTLRQNGASSSGLIQWNADGTPVVLLGGTTAPGVSTVPVTAFVFSGLWVKPYVEAWTANEGYMTHAVPIDANSVRTDADYGCYYP